MKLLIDIGNTRVKWALVDEHLICKGDDDDWSKVEKCKAEILSVWISCVGNDAALTKVVKHVKNLCGLESNVAKVSSKAGLLVNHYQDLDRLGVDRWVAAIGARSLYIEGDLIIIDVGTAVTIDCVNAGNHYLGGVILPGFMMMHDSLVGSTAGIRSQRQNVFDVIGKNTQECVNAGAHFGLVGAIERVVNEMTVRLGSNSIELLITGGDAQLVMDSSRLPFSYHANLLFDGLISLSEQSEVAKNALSFSL